MCDGRDGILHTVLAFKNIDTIVTIVTVRKGAVNEEDNYSSNNPCDGSNSVRPYMLLGSQKTPLSYDIPGTL